MRGCWCGNPKLLPFGPEYRECRICGTLVSLIGLSDNQSVVQNDDIDYYGKKYWLKHQKQDFGYPDIYTRAQHGSDGTKSALAIFVDEIPIASGQCAGSRLRSW